MPGCGEGSCRRSRYRPRGLHCPSDVVQIHAYRQHQVEEGAAGRNPCSLCPQVACRMGLGAHAIAWQQLGLAQPALFAAWHQDCPDVTRRTSNDRPRSRHPGTRPCHLLTHRSCAMFRRCGHRAGVRWRTRGTRAPARPRVRAKAVQAEVAGAVQRSHWPIGLALLLPSGIAHMPGHRSHLVCVRTQMRLGW